MIMQMPLNDIIRTTKLSDLCEPLEDDEVIVGREELSAKCDDR